jgi:hypothetical protein
MKVTIDRNICDASLNSCEHCFSFFIQHPEGVDRYCIIEQVDDGSDKMTLTMLTDGLERTLVLDDKDREMVAAEGWASMVDFVPKFYRGG